MCIVIIVNNIVYKVSGEGDNGAAANIGEPVAPSAEANIIGKISTMVLVSMYCTGMYACMYVCHVLHVCVYVCTAYVCMYVCMSK